ncbi:hypothetical protein SOVF_013490 [Spinacia oleracea]|uniref:DNA polymerase II subunit B3-1 n=1 Tax=Spinacia oleracea TaxID=3562 RepID=A0A9R0IQ62_SPIOL|nr:DNA polymerase II subunit B3-1 [Spinacia oleracea]KNA24660.1 hypothetical protein SOVF_013490 [Spinacia oleracea]
MAEEEENTSIDTPQLSLPVGRVKKIVKFDKDITRISSEALFLVSGATELFLQLLAEKSAEIAADKKRKIIKLEHIRTAVKRHQPTSDFLLDSLPLPPSSHPTDHPVADHTVKERSVLPPNTRRIDSIFRKPPPQNDDLRTEAPVDEDET